MLAHRKRRDGREESLQGWGRTEEAAIADLIDNTEVDQ